MKYLIVLMLLSGCTSGHVKNGDKVFLVAECIKRMPEKPIDSFGAGQCVEWSDYFVLEIK